MLNRAGIWTVVTLLVGLGAGATVAAPPPLPPTGGVRIESITHSARAPLQAGDSFSVTLRGSAGANATFGILGVVADVRLREARPGVYGAQPALYLSSFAVRPGDAARNAAILANLRVGGQDVIGVSDRPITIDTRPPVIIALSPRPQSSIVNTRPNIVVNFDDRETTVNPSAVRLVVNGRDVSARATITDTFAAYNPEVPFSSGPVRVQVAMADRARNAARAEWGFIIAPANDVIKSVTINPTTPLQSGDVLTVVMTGAPGGEASFVIEGILGAVPMREARTPGLYFGSYAARPGQNVIGAALVVTLAVGDRRSTAAATTGVTILTTPPPPPTILSPKNGDRLGSSIVVRGRARPGLRILGRISFDTDSHSGENNSSLGEFSTTAAADGTWEIARELVVRLRGAKFTISAFTIDAAGQRSTPAMVEVSQ